MGRGDFFPHLGQGRGNGVSASNLIGRTLAPVVLGLEGDYAQSPLVSDPPAYLPPEPIRSVGARAVRGRSSAARSWRTPGGGPTLCRWEEMD